MTNRNRTTADLCLIIAAIIVMAGFLAFTTGIRRAGAMGIAEKHVYTLQVKGDCFADRATGDLYATPDGYCMTGNTATMPVNDTKKSGDAQREEKGIVVPPPVVKTILPPPVKVISTPPPVKTIVPPPPPPPPPVTETTCKNKNSGKDGTPKECNAGVGQEK